MVEQTRDDHITLEFQVEDWIDTSKANLTLSIDMALDAKDASSARGEILESLAAILDIEWRVVSLNRTTDRTGLERWQASVEQRVDESQLTGLSVKTKKASKPGLQVRIASVDYTPTVEEFETFLTGLRRKIYAKVNDEVEYLNDTYETDYRIGSINFNDNANNVLLECATSNSRKHYGGNAIAAAAVMTKSYSDTDYGSPAGGGGDEESLGFSVSRKVTMTGRVVLASLVI